MTIFVKIGKLFLTRAIKEAIDHSAQADSSNFNTVLMFLHCPRDLELGRAKREQLSALMTELNKFQTRDNDEISLHQFQALLMSFKTRLANLTQAKQLSEGDTGKALLQALELIQSIYTQMQTLRLLNIPKNNDALVFFQYYAAQYFAIKICANQRLNLVQNMTEQPYFSIFRERAQAREILITQALTQCMSDLDALDKKNPTHRTAVVRQVTLNIEALLRNERTLHERYGTKIDATISLLNLISVTQQDNDWLNQCMEEALRALQMLTQQKTEPELSDWCNAEDEREWAEDAQKRTDMENGLARQEIEALETLARATKEREEAAAAIALATACKTWKDGIPQETAEKNADEEEEEDADEEEAYDDDDEAEALHGQRWGNRR